MPRKTFQFGSLAQGQKLNTFLTSNNAAFKDLLRLHFRKWTDEETSRRLAIMFRKIKQPNIKFHIDGSLTIDESHGNDDFCQSKLDWAFGEKFWSYEVCEEEKRNERVLVEEIVTKGSNCNFKTTEKFTVSQVSESKYVEGFRAYGVSSQEEFISRPSVRVRKYSYQLKYPSPKYENKTGAKDPFYQQFVGWKLDHDQSAFVCDKDIAGSPFLDSLSRLFNHVASDHDDRPLSIDLNTFQRPYTSPQFLPLFTIVRDLASSIGVPIGTFGSYTSAKLFNVANFPVADIDILVPCKDHDQFVEQLECELEAIGGSYRVLLPRSKTKYDSRLRLEGGATETIADEAGYTTGPASATAMGTGTCIPGATASSLLEKHTRLEICLPGSISTVVVKGERKEQDMEEGIKVEVYGGEDHREKNTNKGGSGSSNSSSAGDEMLDGFQAVKIVSGSDQDQGHHLPKGEAENAGKDDDRAKGDRRGSITTHPRSYPPSSPPPPQACPIQLDLISRSANNMNVLFSHQQIHIYPHKVVLPHRSQHTPYAQREHPDPQYSGWSSRANKTIGAAGWDPFTRLARLFQNFSAGTTRFLGGRGDLVAVERRGLLALALRLSKLYNLANAGTIKIANWGRVCRLIWGDRQRQGQQGQVQRQSQGRGRRMGGRDGRYLRWDDDNDFDLDLGGGGGVSSGGRLEDASFDLGRPLLSLADWHIGGQVFPGSKRLDLLTACAARGAGGAGAGDATTSKALSSQSSDSSSSSSNSSKAGSSDKQSDRNSNNKRPLPSDGGSSSGGSSGGGGGGPLHAYDTAVSFSQNDQDPLFVSYHSFVGILKQFIQHCEECDAAVPRRPRPNFINPDGTMTYEEAARVRIMGGLPSKRSNGDGGGGDLMEDDEEENIDSDD